MHQRYHHRVTRSPLVEPHSCCCRITGTRAGAVLLAAAAAVLACSVRVARADFDWARAEALAPGVEMVTTTIVKEPEAGLTCPQYAAFDPAAPRKVALGCVRVDLTRPGTRCEATPRAAGWGQPMPPHGDKAFPDLVIRTALQTVPDFVAAERAAGVPVVLGVNASPWEPFVPGKAFEHADRMGLVVDDGVVVSPATGRPALVIGHDGSAELRVVNPGDDLTAIETAVSGFSFCLIDGVPSAPDDVLHPRTGFGLSADGKTLFILVADGRQAASQGLTVREVGELLRDMGADDGVNMDGGGSTTLVAAPPGSDGFRVVNRPSGGLRRNGANLVIAVDRAPRDGRE
ncbi:MAG: phosphodiester glycosidase family protein [Planctomycetes bacterium]|nr:phosphodiester glycosidase family protein [Planctomycetota bacterium]